MSTAPDFMPVLSRGGHSDPSQGACVMEYVSLLAGEEFSDTPACTDPHLAWYARSVNDRLHDRHRHLLVPLITRLIGTSTVGYHTDPPMDGTPYRLQRVYLHDPSDENAQALVDRLALLIEEHRERHGITDETQITEADKDRLLSAVPQGASA